MARVKRSVHSKKGRRKILERAHGYKGARSRRLRTAHEQVGLTVRHAETRGQELWELSLEEIREFAPLAQDDLFDWLKIENSVARRRSPGGTAPERVTEALERAEAELGLNPYEQRM